MILSLLVDEKPVFSTTKERQGVSRLSSSILSLQNPGLCSISVRALDDNYNNNSDILIIYVLCAGSRIRVLRAAHPCHQGCSSSGQQGEPRTLFQRLLCIIFFQSTGSRRLTTLIGYDLVRS